MHCHSPSFFYQTFDSVNYKWIIIMDRIRMRRLKCGHGTWHKFSKPSNTLLFRSDDKTLLLACSISFFVSFTNSYQNQIEVNILEKDSQRPHSFTIEWKGLQILFDLMINSRQRFKFILNGYCESPIQLNYLLHINIYLLFKINLASSQTIWLR